MFLTNLHGYLHGQRYLLPGVSPADFVCEANVQKQREFPPFPDSNREDPPTRE